MILLSKLPLSAIGGGTVVTKRLKMRNSQKIIVFNEALRPLKPTKLSKCLKCLNDTEMSLMSQ